MEDKEMGIIEKMRLDGKKILITGGWSNPTD